MTVGEGSRFSDLGVRKISRLRASSAFMSLYTFRAQGARVLLFRVESV